MRYAIIETATGKVINVIEGDSAFDPGPGLSLEKADARAQPGGHWNGASFSAATQKKTEILEVSDYQFRLALNTLGLREDFEAAIDNGSPGLRDYWDRALVVPRHHWFARDLATMLQLDEKAVDQLFSKAAEF